MTRNVGRSAVRGVVHGLVVESPFDLPNTVPLTGERPADLVMRLGSRDDSRAVLPEPPVVVASQPEGVHRYWLSRGIGGGHELHVPAVLDATVDRTGSEVVVRPAPEVTEAHLALVVSGLLMALVLTVRGDVVLHASAVERGGRALAVIGPSGSGKSTMAGLLCAAGARLLSDDHLRIDLAGGARCWRSAVLLRTRPGGLGVDVGALQGAVSAMSADGRILVAPPVSDLESCPIEALVVPALHPAIDRLQRRELSGAAAAVALLTGRALPGRLSPQWQAQLFDRALAIAAAVPVWQVAIPWDRDRSADAAAELLDVLPADG